MKRRFVQVLALAVLLLQAVEPVFARDPMKSIKVATTPNSTITRAGAVAVIISANASNMPRVRFLAAHMPPLALFRDVDQTHWYAPYIEVAFEQGIVTGNADGLFRPNDPLTQADAVALSIREHEATYGNDGVFLTIASGESQDATQRFLAQANYDEIRLPSTFIASAPITRGDLFPMLQSAGINHPEHTEVAYIPVGSDPASRNSTTATTANSNPNTNHVLRAVTNQPRYVAPTAPILANVTSTYAQTQPSVIAQAVQPVSSQFSISMPSLGIDSLAISHPSDYSHDGLLVPLRTGVGQLFSYPGQGGKILIYGHSSGYPWDVSQYTKVFRQINRLQVGDIVTINYNGTAYSYRVTVKKTVPASDNSAYAQAGKEELVLYTCWPPDSIKERYLVFAEPVTTTIAGR